MLVNLKAEDFKLIKAENNIRYLQYKFKDGTKRSICLEPCLNGFCIGYYDGEDEMITDKICTNIHGQLIYQDVLNKALRIANHIIKYF